MIFKRGTVISMDRCAQDSGTAYFIILKDVVCRKDLDLHEEQESYFQLGSTCPSCVTCFKEYGFCTTLVGCLRDIRTFQDKHCKIIHTEKNK